MAPHTRAGRKVVDQAIAALIVDVENGCIHIGEDPTLSQLLDRWVTGRSPEWSPKTTSENRRQIRLKILPRMGKRRVSKIRASDLDALYAEPRTRDSESGGPLWPASVSRTHLARLCEEGHIESFNVGIALRIPADGSCAS